MQEYLSEEKLQFSFKNMILKRNLNQRMPKNPLKEIAYERRELL